MLQPDRMHNGHSNVEKLKLSLEQDVGAVIVAYDVHISLIKITKACTYLNNPNCIFIATNTDRRKMIPDKRVILPGEIAKHNRVFLLNNLKKNII